MTACALCDSVGGELLFAGRQLRVVAADEALHPGFCRVIWNAHVAEMSDLPPAARSTLMGAVFATESALRAVLAPDKINLASLGNQVPHLHWHVIARFRDDPHFPAPIWSPPQRTAVPPLPPDWRAQVRARLRAEPPDEAA